MLGNGCASAVDVELGWESIRIASTSPPRNYSISSLTPQGFQWSGESSFGSKAKRRRRESLLF
jgi:hypothetical protein